MKIYLDYVFFINFLFDMILLLGISILLKRNVSLKRIILGSVIGGLSTFILFLNINSIILFIFKILSGILMIIITFKYKNLKYTLINTIYLIILSILLGGSLYLINIEIGYEQMGFIFFTNGKSVNIFILIIISALIIFLYTKMILKTKKEINYKYQVDIYLKTKKIKLNGYLDTGNELYDPYFNKPIIIANKGIKITSKKSIFVPFNTLNSKGLLECFFIDKIFIKGVGELNNVLVAVSPNNFSLEGVDLILHKDLIKEKK